MGLIFKIISIFLFWNIGFSQPIPYAFLSQTGIITDGLVYYWNYLDLTTSPVANWRNRRDTMTLRQTIPARQPILSSGVLFDTTDLLRGSTFRLPLNGRRRMTIEIIVKITDTNSFRHQYIFAYRNNAYPMTIIAMKIQTHRRGSWNKIGTSYFNGATFVHRCFKTNEVNFIGTFKRFTITCDSVDRQRLYINGTQILTFNSRYSTLVRGQLISLGDSQNTGGMVNGTVRIFLFYNRVLSSTELIRNGRALNRYLN